MKHIQAVTITLQDGSVVNAILDTKSVNGLLRWSEQSMHALQYIARTHKSDCACQPCLVLGDWDEINK